MGAFIKNIHDHCTGCVSISCSVTHYCPIIICKDCSHQMHRCKSDEHDLLCPMAMVPCINFAYGCSLRLLRRNTGRHLEDCPASVVFCNSQWNRWPLCKDFRRHVRQWSKLPDVQNSLLPLQSLPPDVGALIGDQQKFAQLFDIPSSRRRMFRDWTNIKYPAMPIQLHFLDESVISRENFTPSRSSSVTSIIDAPWKLAVEPPGLSRSVAQQLRINFSTKTCGQNNKDNFVSSEPACVEDDDFSDEDMLEKAKVRSAGQALTAQRCTLCRNVEEPQLFTACLKLSLDFMAPSSAKPPCLLTFQCGKSVKRSHFSQHYSLVHCDLMPGLDGWLFRRCPLFEYGCTYSEWRFKPALRSVSYFGSGYDDFAFSYCDIADEIPAPAGVALTTFLPKELIFRVCTYLDCGSLAMLSATCHTLRNITQRLLNKHGFVELVWIKDCSKRWIPKTVWKFSPMLVDPHTQLKTWQLCTSKMNAHLASCSYNDRLMRTEPWRVIDRMFFNDRSYCADTDCGSTSIS